MIIKNMSCRISGDVLKNEKRNRLFFHILALFFYKKKIFGLEIDIYLSLDSVNCLLVDVTKNIVPGYFGINSVTVFERELIGGAW